MLYFKKNNNMYCKLDPLTSTFYEVFVGTTQVRVAAFTEEPTFYSQAYQRMQDHGFEEGTSAEFEAFLAFAITRLNP
jgi:hypothetical protein